MTDKKTIAVLGATGGQGGGLVRAILADPQARSPSARSTGARVRSGRGCWPRPWENFALGLGPIRGEDGKLVFTLPMGERKLAGMAVEDVGRTALGIFARAEEYIGRTVSIAGEHLTGEQLAETFAEAFGEPVDYRPLTHNQFRALPIPGAAEFVRSLNPRLQTFRDWLDTHKEQLRPA
jgi:uncharacterized protein YbjT (DUF2867 family)